MMQLIEELPAMAALFACGVAGYVGTRWLRSHVNARVYQAAKIAAYADVASPKAACCEDDLEPVPAVSGASAKQARRRRRTVGKISTSSTASPQEEEPVAEQMEEERAAALMEAAGEPAPGTPAAEEPELEAPAVSERVARLMAKKAARKARKALVQASPAAVPEAPVQEEEDLPKPDHAEVSTEDADAEEHCADAHAQCGATDDDEEATEPKVSGEEAIQMQEVAFTQKIGALELEAEESDEEEEDWSEPEPDGQQALREAPDCWSSTWEGSPSCPRPHWGGWSKSWGKAKQQDDDWWMTPFDDLIHGKSFQGPLPPPARPPVCIWSGPRKEQGEGGQEVFTDGMQLYRPVSSPTGQQLFTDGRQLFAAVCVAVPEPQDSAPSPAGEGEQAADEEAQVHALLEALSPRERRPFDPYDPLGLAPPEIAAEEEAEAISDE